MHIRNPYRKPPNFEELAESFPALKSFVARESDGSPTLDFRDPAAQRALTCALLHRDFGLKLELPPDRLCPPVPNRLNYILWLQDVQYASTLADAFSPMSTSMVQGLDIGTGASAIYPLLGCALEPSWSFIGTDVDQTSLESARKNVQANGLESRISVVDADADGPILGPLFAPDYSNTCFAFTMCNPPFYSSRTAMRISAAMKSGTPRGALTAGEAELLAPGGEVTFVGRMVDESIRAQTRCLWYTSLLGHLSSLTPLVEKLRELKIENYAVTELVQGQTRRWILGWSFNDARLPDAMARISNPAVHSLLPPRNSLLFPLTSRRLLQLADLHEALQAVLAGLTGLHIRPTPARSDEDGHPELLVAASANTWSRSARRRAAQTTGDVSAAVVGGTVSVAWTLICQIRWSRPDATVENAVPAVLHVDWLRGSDRPLFEGFAAHIARKLQTALG